MYYMVWGNSVAKFDCRLSLNVAKLIVDLIKTRTMSKSRRKNNVANERNEHCRKFQIIIRLGWVGLVKVS
jgi:hypothetical protein